MGKPRIIIAADRPRRLTKYRLAVEEAGGEVEPIYPESEWSSVLERVDGLLLTGGGDIDAAEFQEANHPSVHHVEKNRDKMELTLTRQALQRNVPVFGICRGLQVMNVALGGNLLQHIPDETRNLIVHDDTGHRQNLAHEVIIREGTLLHRILGTSRTGVNSFHHQAIKDLGKGLIKTAWAEDGVIEAVELPSARFFLGVQWHPEEFVEHGGLFHGLFEAFIDSCRKF